MPELSYTERDTDLDFTGSDDTAIMDSDLCLNVAAGVVSAEFYCGGMFMPVPSDDQISFEMEAIKSPNSAGPPFGANEFLWHPPAARQTEYPVNNLVYITLTDPGDYTFRVHVVTLNEGGAVLLGAPPMLPMWLRIVALQDTPPSGASYSIRATVGL